MKRGLFIAIVQILGVLCYGQGDWSLHGWPVRVSYPNEVQVLVNTGFAVGYDETRKNPAWVCYIVPEQVLVDRPLRRPGRFITDFRTLARVKHEDYTRSGFDRGHMAPNLAISSRFGAEAQEQTFLLSNITPQAPALNQGPWRLLEDVIVNRAVHGREKLYVIVGPIYVEDDQFTFLPSGVEVPSGFFCIVADELKDGRIKAQAFILPQAVDRAADFRRYRTSVDYVEAESGWDFFSALPALLQAKFEAEVTPYWLDMPAP